MAKYGNIMIVYNCDDIQLEQIKSACTELGVKSEIKENSFFIETNSKVNTRDLINAITNLNIEFLFFHNNNSDGSVLESNGIDPDVLAGARKIMFL